MPTWKNSNRQCCENKWKTMARQILVAVIGKTNPRQIATDAGGQLNAQPMKHPTNRPILNKWSCQMVIYLRSSGSQESPAVNTHICALAQAYRQQYLQVPAMLEASQRNTYAQANVHIQLLIWDCGMFVCAFGLPSARTYDEMQIYGKTKSNLLKDGNGECAQLPQGLL